MKTRKLHGPPGVENRWFLILPALAFAMGCESKAEAPTAEPLPANSEATPEPAQPTVAELTGNPTPRAAETVAIQATADPAAEVTADEGATTEGKLEKTPPAGERQPKAAEPVADDGPRRGPAVSGEGFNAWLEGKASYPLNQAATVTVVLTASAPYKCNEEYPYKFTLSPNPSLGVPDAPVRSMNVSAQRSTMTIPIRPSAAGKHTLSGELAFSVCTEDKCLIEKKALSLPFDVTGS